MNPQVKSEPQLLIEAPLPVEVVKEEEVTYELPTLKEVTKTEK